jgi:thioesterase domain-containing protein
VSLHARGRHPALFCVHPVGGQVLCYANLARQLGAAVETLARHHLEALRPVQPSGPYRLAGWSYGGLVALEMARQLEDEGQRVCFLALLDTALPPAATSCPAPPPEEGALIEWFLRDLIFTGPRALALPAFGSLEDGFAFGVQRGALPADFDLALGRVLYHVFRTNMLALWRYAPRRVAAPLTVVRAQERPAADGPFDVRLEHWERFTPVLHLVEVPGDHFTLLQGTGLAAALRAGLDAVRTAGPRAVSLEDSRP